MVVLIPLISTSARANDRAVGEWQLDVKASYVVLGTHEARATGGIMPSLTGLYRWSLHEAVAIGLGADGGIFGLGGIAHWFGVLGGPVAVAHVKPFTVPLTFDLAARFDFGRIPVCNEAGVCLRYIGFFPAIEPGAAYRFAQHAAVSVTCGFRIIQTLAWSGAAVEPALAARFFW